MQDYLHMSFPLPDTASLNLFHCPLRPLRCLSSFGQTNLMFFLLFSGCLRGANIVERPVHESLEDEPVEE